MTDFVCTSGTDCPVPAGHLGHHPGCPRSGRARGGARPTGLVIPATPADVRALQRADGEEVISLKVVSAGQDSNRDFFGVAALESAAMDGFMSMTQAARMLEMPEYDDTPFLQNPAPNNENSQARDLSYEDMMDGVQAIMGEPVQSSPPYGPRRVRGRIDPITAFTTGGESGVNRAQEAEAEDVQKAWIYLLWSGGRVKQPTHRQPPRVMNHTTRASIRRAISLIPLEDGVPTTLGAVPWDRVDLTKVDQREAWTQVLLTASRSGGIVPMIVGRMIEELPAGHVAAICVETSTRQGRGQWRDPIFASLNGWCDPKLATVFDGAFLVARACSDHSIPIETAIDVYMADRSWAGVKIAEILVKKVPTHELVIGASTKRAEDMARHALKRMTPSRRRALIEELELQEAKRGP